MYSSVYHLELIMYKGKYTLLKQFMKWRSLKCALKQIRLVVTPCFPTFQLSTSPHDVSKGIAEKRAGFVFNKRLNHTEKTEQSTFVCRESVTACFGYFSLF